MDLIDSMNKLWSSVTAFSNINTTGKKGVLWRQHIINITVIQHTVEISCVQITDDSLLYKITMIRKSV